MEDRLTISVLSPISESIEQDHGIAMFYPLSGVIMSEKLTEGQRSVLWHMGCWAVFTLGAFGLYGACRQLGLSRATALLGPVFLLLTPRFFAHGHFNNKDIVLMALACCLLWQGIRLLKEPTVLKALVFSAFGALAANTKVAGAALWGLCSLLVLIAQIAGRRMNTRTWISAGTALVSFVFFYVLITPACWADPAAFVRYLINNALAFQRWQNQILFRGTVFSLRVQQLPWYYLPYMIFVTTPLWLLLLAALGNVTAVVRLRRSSADEALSLLMALSMWMLPLGFAVISRTSVYNGWRHFYFVYGPLLALAVWGVSRLMNKRILAAGLACCMVLSAAGIAMEHPRQYAYYQPLVQLRGTNFNELDYWNISARDALEQLAAETEGEITIAPADLWAEDALKKAAAVLPEETAARIHMMEDAQYVLSNPTYACFSGFLGEGMRECVRLDSYGQPIMRIYERTKEAEMP